jgi:hypothetical protein
MRQLASVQLGRIVFTRHAMPPIRRPAAGRPQCALQASECSASRLPLRLIYRSYPASSAAGHDAGSHPALAPRPPRSCPAGRPAAWRPWQADRPGLPGQWRPRGPPAHPPQSLTAASRGFAQVRHPLRRHVRPRRSGCLWTCPPPVPRPVTPTVTRPGETTAATARAAAARTTDSPAQACRRTGYYRGCSTRYNPSRCRAGEGSGPCCQHLLSGPVSCSPS